MNWIRLFIYVGLWPIKEFTPWANAIQPTNTMLSSINFTAIIVSFMMQENPLHLYLPAYDCSLIGPFNGLFDFSQ